MYIHKPPRSYKMQLSGLPSLPTHFARLERFPFTEGLQFEFKESVSPMNRDKTYQTVCAFLNSNGGYMVFGVTDSGVIRGVRRKNVDELLLRLDCITYNKLIIDTKTLAPPSLHDICTQVIPLVSASTLKGTDVIPLVSATVTDETFIVIVRALNPDPSHTFQLAGGETYIRLNASNFKTMSGRPTNIDGIFEENLRLTAEMLRLRETTWQIEKSHKKLLDHVKEQSTQLKHLQIVADDCQRLLEEKILTEKVSAEAALQMHTTCSLFQTIFKCLLTL
jgi:hypothetical protein